MSKDIAIVLGFFCVKKLVLEWSNGEMNNAKNNILLKIQMYMISLCLLFVLIIPISFEVPAKMKDWQEWCKTNVLTLICLFMIFIIFILIKQLEYRWKGTKELPVTVSEVKSENFEYLTFLTTYIIPLVCIDMDNIRYIIVLFLLLIIIGVIFVKSDFYLGNPTLALLGYKLYTIQYTIGENSYEKLVITKDKIQEKDLVEFIPFDKNIWYVRRSR